MAKDFENINFDLPFCSVPIMNKSEYSFYCIMKEAVEKVNKGAGPKYILLIKPRLIDFVETLDHRGKEVKRTKEQNHVFISLHIDFVIVASDGMAVVCIEIDGATHRTHYPTKYTDKIKELVLERAQIPLVRVNKSANYKKEKNFQQAADQIVAEYLEKKQRPGISPAGAE